MTGLASDVAMLTAVGGLIQLRPTVFSWCSAETARATHVRLSGALPPELIGIFPIAKNEGNLIVLELPDALAESKRPVGCNIEFLQSEDGKEISLGSTD